MPCLRARKNMPGCSMLRDFEAAGDRPIAQAPKSHGILSLSTSLAKTSFHRIIAPATPGRSGAEEPPIGHPANPFPVLVLDTVGYYRPFTIHHVCT